MRERNDVGEIPDMSLAIAFWKAMA